MINMKLNYIFSHIYFRALNKNKPVRRNWDEVKHLGRAFLDKYESAINKIISEIPKITGKNFKKEQIDVYFVDWNGPSFSNPLTFKVREDYMMMHVVLTHELMHHLFPEKRGGMELEREINSYVEKVFSKLGIQAREQINSIRNHTEFE